MMIKNKVKATVRASIALALVMNVQPGYAVNSEEATRIIPPIIELLLSNDNETPLPDTCRAEFLKDTNPGGGDGQSFIDVGPGFTQAGDLVYFRPRGGAGLWVTDGTSNGTRLVTDISPISSSTFAGPVIVPLQDQVFFGAASSSGTSSTLGIGLWRSGSTSGSTELVRDLSPGFNELPQALTEFNNRLFFVSDGLFLLTNSRDEGLWVSDGTDSGTQLVRETNPNSSTTNSSEMMAITNNRLIFSASGEDGFEPWVSDGTTNGTQLLRDIAPQGGSSADGYTAIGDKVFFFANNEATGFEAWVTDGTASGTNLVQDIYPGDESGVIANIFNNQSLDIVDFIDLAGSAVFIANDGVHGFELWISDGTNAGTRMIRDINVGSGNGLQIDALSDAAVLNGKVYFPANDSLGDGVRLWVSDGTSTGTQPFLPATSNASINPQYMLGSQDLLFVNADRELVIIDEDGNSNEIDLRPTTTFGSEPAFFYDFNGQILFFAETGGTFFSPPEPLGRELWSLTCGSK